MLFNNGFDMEPASGAKPASAVVYQGSKQFFMLKCILKEGRGGEEGSWNDLYVYTNFTHLFHISTQATLKCL